MDSFSVSVSPPAYILLPCPVSSPTWCKAAGLSVEPASSRIPTHHCRHTSARRGVGQGPLLAWTRQALWFPGAQSHARLCGSFKTPRVLMKSWLDCRVLTLVLIAGFFEGGFVTNRLTPSVWSRHGNVRSCLSKAKQTIKHFEC